MTHYAIYLTHNTGKCELTSVLLDDDAWTNEDDCFMREFGHVLHRPRLFTAEGARTYARGNGLTGKRYSVRQYTGPTEPWDRD